MLVRMCDARDGWNVRNDRRIDDWTNVSFDIKASAGGGPIPKYHGGPTDNSPASASARDEIVVLTPKPSVV
jgi:hypothetical protein